MADRRRVDRGRRTASIRFRVTALATVSVLAVLIVTAIALVLHQRRVLTESVDEALELEIVDITSEISSASSSSGVALDGVVDDDGVAQILDANSVLAATANLSGRAPITDPPRDGSEIHTVDGVLADESEFRVLTRAVTADGRDLVVHVGASLEDVNESTGALIRALAVGVPAVAVALALLVWLLVGRTLAPVEGIRAEVAAIGASELHRRVPRPGTGDEIDGLAETMNGMLDRLEGASERQQQFVADASHELRSPLTRIRAEIEVDLANPERADPQATLRSVLAEATELESLADDLLALARTDAGAAKDAWHPVDLDDIVLRLVRRPRTATHVAVEASGVSAAQVLGDDRQLTRAVGNLVDNALRHARRAVTLTLAEHDNEAVLSVADDGPGIPEDQRERVFERFTRIDDARTRNSGGAGLGLAITREIIERHRGTVAVDPRHEGGARFVVTLPLGNQCDTR